MARSKQRRAGASPPPDRRNGATSDPSTRSSLARSSSSIVVRPPTVVPNGRAKRVREVTTDSETDFPAPAPVVTRRTSKRLRMQNEILLEPEVKVEPSPSVIYLPSDEISPDDGYENDVTNGSLFNPIDLDIPNSDSTELTSFIGDSASRSLSGLSSGSSEYCPSHRQLPPF